MTDVVFFFGDPVERNSMYQLKQWQEMGGDFPDVPVPEVDDQYLKDHGFDRPSTPMDS